MLVLSRQRDESVMIGDLIEVNVVDIRGDKVRLGFQAPRSYPIHRKEVYDAILRENKTRVLPRSDDVTAAAMVKMAELRNRLCREGALMFCDGNTAILALQEVGNFGINYQITLYTWQEVSGKTVIVVESLHGCVEKGEALAFFFDHAAQLHLQPNESTGPHLSNVLKIAGKAMDSRNSSAGVPSTPVKALSK